MLPAVSRREWSWAFCASALLVMVASLPYLLGWLLVPEGYHFSGLLINPVDGHSYLAKMGQGAAGAWLFHLPYTATPHEPVLLFLYHILLGHLAPGGNPVALVWVYHLARMLWGWLLLVAVYWAAAFFTAEVAQRRYSLLLAGLAGGLGWLIGDGPDLMVPESVTFASLFVNGHFALTSLLILWLILRLCLAPPRRWLWLVDLLAAIWLALIQPFGILIVGAVAGVWWLLRSVPAGRARPDSSHDLDEEREGGRKTRPLVLAWLRLLSVGLVVLPIGLYDVWITRNNPAVAGWMAQNLTPSPPWWQWLTAYGLVGLLALAGLRPARNRSRGPAALLVVWLAVQVGLMALPLALQRRLSTGLHLPLVLLAGIGLWQWLLPRIHGRWRRWLPRVILVLVLPSNLLLMMAGLSGAWTRNPAVVFTDDQWETLAWLRQQADADTVVLADDEMGTVAPAWGGGARVVYGHPFETLDVEETKAAVDDFYAGRFTPAEQEALLRRYAVDYVLLQTDRYPGLHLPESLDLIWQAGTVQVYGVEGG